MPNMELLSTNLAYTHPVSGKPSLSKTYEFTGKEQEIVDLVPEIKAETDLPTIESGLLAVAALPSPDATFIEWISGGVLTLTETGALTGDPSVLSWLLAVRDGERVL